MLFRLLGQDIPLVDTGGKLVPDWYDRLRQLEGPLTSTVAHLPAAGAKGSRNFVTDATATTFGTIVAGGGANNVPVYDDGTNWRIG